jgi:hypothetical protein
MSDRAIKSSSSHLIGRDFNNERIFLYIDDLTPLTVNLYSLLLPLIFDFRKSAVLINNLQILSQYILWLLHTYLLISQLRQALEFCLTICHFLLTQKEEL